MHSNGSKDSSPKKDVAVYIDYENLYISLRSTVGQNPNFDVIMDKCRDFGRLTVTRAYADWSEFARVVTSQLFSSGVDPIYVPTRKFYDAKTRSQATKNSVDIHITIDIMKDVLQSKNIDCFVLVSGDRDFVPLMNQIRAAGKEVYAIGVAGCTSSELAVAVDEMFYYHQLLESDEEVANEQRDIYSKLVRAIEIARGRGYRGTLGVIKPIMRELVGGFDERKLRNTKGVPFQKFKQFVMEAERQGFIRVAEAGETVELFLASEQPKSRPAPSSAPAEDRDRSGGSRQRSGGRGGNGEAERTSPDRSAAPSESRDADSDAADDTDGDAVASSGDAASTEPGGSGRRRGRRGGRGRGRRGRGAPGDPETSSDDSEEDDEPSSDVAASGRDAASGDHGDAGEGDLHAVGDDADERDRDERARDDRHERDRNDRLERDRSERERNDRDRHERNEREAGSNGGDADGASSSGADEAREPAPRASRAPAASSRRREAPAAAAAPAASRRIEEDDDDLDDDDADLTGLEDMTLPPEAFGDLEEIMRTFEGRAPSQRRLIARLKKGATSGELKGDYRDGQFLLLVRKALQDGYLERVSKGFYAGVRWNDQRAASAT